MRLIIKAEQLGLFGGAPKKSAAPKAPQGFSPIPGSKHGGYHKREGEKFVYWYPDTGVVGSLRGTEPAEVHAAHAAAQEGAAPTPSKIQIVRMNPETGAEEEIRPGVTKQPAPPPAELPPVPTAEPAKPKPTSKPKAVPKQEPLLTVQPGKAEAAEPTGKYETTGYVFGSRAELWSLRNSGELEKDPAVAYKLVTKDAVLGGKVEPSSFAAEQAAGTEPAAAYMKYRLMQAIQSRPDDSPDARERFSKTIAAVQGSMASIRTMADMRLFVQEIKDQLEGVAPKEELTEEELKKRGWWALFEPAPERAPMPFTAEQMGKMSLGESIRVQQQWKETDQPRINAWRNARSEANQRILAYYNGHCDIRKIGDKYVAMAPMVKAMHEEQISNLETLGPRFLAIIGKKIEYPNRKRDPEWMRRLGYDPNQRRVSGAFDSEFRRGVLHEAKTIEDEDKNLKLGIGKGDPWAWLGAKKEKTKEKVDTSAKRTDKEEEGGDKYHTILAQARLGETKRVGPPVPGNAGIGSAEMKKSLGLHEVEYGHWVGGSGEAERQWHTEAAHAALHDLAAVLGIAPERIGQNGRLTMAFGSRGSGGAKATYHPDVKAINITKLFGQGALAHEWGHFLDNMIMHVSSPEKGKDPYASGGRKDTGSGIAARAVSPELAQALTAVMDTIRYDSTVDPAEAKYVAQEEMESKRRAYYAEKDPQKKEQRRLEVNALVKEYNHAIRSAGRGGFKPETAFYTAAKKMGDYWHRPTEMFARCFEAWVEDRLKGEKRQNTYLVQGTQGFPSMPGYYPTGPHRERVSAAMAAMVEVLRKDDHFSKAMWAQWFQEVTEGPDLLIPQRRA